MLVIMIVLLIFPYVGACKKDHEHDHDQEHEVSEPVYTLITDATLPIR
jgi:hypothetical protein